MAVLYSIYQMVVFVAEASSLISCADGVDDYGLTLFVFQIAV